MSAAFFLPFCAHYFSLLLGLLWFCTWSPSLYFQDPLVHWFIARWVLYNLDLIIHSPVQEFLKIYYFLLDYAQIKSLSMAFSTPCYLVLTKSPVPSTACPHVPEFLPTSLNISNLQLLDDNYCRYNLLHFLSLYRSWFYVGETIYKKFLKRF